MSTSLDVMVELRIFKLYGPDDARQILARVEKQMQVGR